MLTSAMTKLGTAFDITCLYCGEELNIISEGYGRLQCKTSCL